MIKAEDLRIGDLVRYGMDIVSVLAVHSNGSVCFADGKDQICVEQVLLEPIPLTQEILEKNGFEVAYPEKSYIKLFIGSPRRELIRFLSIENWQTEWKVFLKYTNRANYVLLRFVNYVHELQHILWVLGENANLKI